MKTECANLARLTLLTISGVSAFSLAGAAFAVSCGDTVTTPETLDASIVACATSPAVTITDAGSLDLNGYTISCNGAGIGVQILGSGRTLSDSSLGAGSVESCDVGISVEGVGGHYLEFITVVLNNFSGISIISDANFFLGVISGSSTFGNGGVGLRLAGANNQILQSAFEKNTLSGVEISGNNNYIKQSSALSNSGSGFVITTANNITLDSVTANDNGVDGILAEASSMSGGLIFNSTARDNSGDDLSDQNTIPCGRFQWINNDFGTANNSCID
ncbi:right-handed parallel beta-helix repeat-containing protein [Microbulbifer sp. ANSA005]|uniref:right-handed parallel beta-helix repeat-containing protein n=1 Tax=Microbulbifer sp. ANSA005 TaxID=3243362 RepID=UPI004042A23A